MEEFVPFGSRDYIVLFLVLFTARAMDFLSTWVATPNLVLEGNPIAKRLGWKFGIPVNIVLSILFAFWPLPAIVISTTSALVAARNFQSAWLMRSLGEHCYRDWHIARVRETRASLYLACLVAQTFLVASVGGAVMLFSDFKNGPVLPAIGLGIIAYAVAVFGFTLLSVVRMRKRASQLNTSNESSRAARAWPD